jgi:hypothetical protein
MIWYMHVTKDTSIFSSLSRSFCWWSFIFTRKCLKCVFDRCLTRSKSTNYAAIVRTSSYFCCIWNSTTFPHINKIPIDERFISISIESYKFFTMKFISLHEQILYCQSLNEKDFIRAWSPRTFPNMLLFAFCNFIITTLRCQDSFT